jgi:opacity protein-like surface antigen
MIRVLRYSLLVMAFACAANAADAVRERAQTEEIVYFVLPDRFENGSAENDRGGLKGDRLQHGFDPTSKAFFHGGDLKGLTARLDYIQALDLVDAGVQEQGGAGRAGPGIGGLSRLLDH